MTGWWGRAQEGLGAGAFLLSGSGNRLLGADGWVGVSKRQPGLLSGGGEETLTPPTGIKPLNSGLLQLNTHLFLPVKCSGHGLEFSKYAINIIKTTI